MTRKLDCPVDGCHATIEAESDEEVMQQAQSHASKQHPDMEMDEETMDSLRSRITDA